MKRKTWSYLLGMGMLATALTACSSGTVPEAADSPRTNEGTNPPAAEKPAEPVKLTIFASISPDLFETIGLNEALKKKHPNISLEVVQINLKDITYQGSLAAGMSPDLVCCSIASIGEFKDLKLVSDLTPLLQAEGWDVNQLQPGMAEVIRSYSEKGEFILMPFYMSTAVLYYNKGLFDKFGVPYPKDGMIWDEVYDVAKRVTRLENGVQYLGFTYNEQNITYKNQFGLAFIDPVTKKAAVHTDQWKKWVDTMSMFAKIPGNQLPQGVSESNGFLKNQITAMRTGQTLLSSLPEAQANGLNWDVASFPEFADRRGAGTQMNAPFFAIPPSSKHKKEVIQFITTLLSEDVQKNLSAKGYVPVIRSEAVRLAFGTELVDMKEKNLQAFFKDTLAKPAPYSEYNSEAANILYRKVQEVQKGKDTNTALREADELINKRLEELTAR